jgi:hypothetical protein
MPLEFRSTIITENFKQLFASTLHFLIGKLNQQPGTKFLLPTHLPSDPQIMNSSSLTYHEIIRQLFMEVMSIV